MGGLSDESGASAPLAMAIKQLGLPSLDEVMQIEEYVHGTLWAGERGERDHYLQYRDYSVRSSMLYWSSEIDNQPTGRAAVVAPSLYAHCHKCWATCSKKKDCCYWMHCWSYEHSLETWRAYNYPHVVAIYWALYRLGRHFNPPLTKREGWRFYLEQAGRTSIAMYRFGGRGTAQWGLMVGSIFPLVLMDLRREGMMDLAIELETIKKKRMAKWMSMEFPYGSEFPWDSTGHEEIHSWLMMDKNLIAANKTVQAVLAYSSLLPHWAYCGSARRYWDFTINGKTQWGNEREFHHYGSTLNAVPILDSYKAFPYNHHLLLLGTCALLGHLSNIHPSGAYSMAWHGDPSLLRRDAYSGDYGPGLYGYWRSAASYITCMPPHGWSCMLCDLEVSEGEGSLEGRREGRREEQREEQECDQHATLLVTPRDAFSRRAYLSPLGMMVIVEGAKIAQLTLHPSSLSATLMLEKHLNAPSAEATIFLDVMRLEPPPPLPLSGYRLTSSMAIRKAEIQGGGGEIQGGGGGEFIVTLAREGQTRVQLEPIASGLSR